MKFPMAKRQYKYVVTITTKRGNNLNGQILEMPYTQARVGHTAPKVDRVEIHSTFIRLTAIRSNDTSPESIVKDNSGTLHKQILKQVLLYYASNLSNPGIKEITVIKDGVENGKYIESYSPLNEPLRNLHWQSDQAFNANDLINHIKLEFDLYGVILSYWLTGISEKNTYSKFESLWRCFEQLCFKSYKGSNSRPKEKDVLKSMREFIRTNEALFQQSCNAVHRMTNSEFRNNFSWRLMILNNYSQYGRKKTPYENYRDELVLPYKDARVLNMLRETLVYREEKLRDFKVYDDILNHLNLYQPWNIVKDSDLLAILCGTMASYKRNKMFHGEILSPSLNLCHTKEDEELKQMNKILEIVDFELIKCYNSL